MNTDEIPDFNKTEPCPHCAELHHPDFMAYHISRQCTKSYAQLSIEQMKQAAPRTEIPKTGKQSRRERRAKERVVKKLFVTVRKPGYKSEQEKAKEQYIKNIQSSCTHPAYVTNTGMEPSKCVVCGKPMN